MIQAEQTENDQTRRNDRIIAAPINDAAAPPTIADLASDLFDDVKRFFVTYQKVEGNGFKVLGVAGVREALELVRSTARDQC
jgi:inorganic pyrophosphatase